MTLGVINTWASSRRPGEEKDRWQTIAEATQADERQKREVENMGKTIAQAIYEEAELKTLQRMLLRLGRSRFGTPDESIESAIREIDNPVKLQALGDRILIANSWSDPLQIS